MFRVSESTDAPTSTGPEMQVLDNAHHADGARSPQLRGRLLWALSAVTRRHPARRRLERRRLVVNGARVEYWMNGVKIVEYDIGSADWLARLPSGPFRDVTTYAREPRGHIALQDHGDRVAYRGIKIRVVTP